MKLFLVLPMLVVAVLLLQARADEDEEIDCLYQKPDCFCLEYEELVCATNGCTYSNPCRLACADEELEHEGECEDVEK